jgi:cystathionine beta-lyase/cystathionine gamma-synthase
MGPLLKDEEAWLPAKNMRGFPLRYKGMTQSVNYQFR